MSPGMAISLVPCLHPPISSNANSPPAVMTLENEDSSSASGSESSTDMAYEDESLSEDEEMEATEEQEDWYYAVVPEVPHLVAQKLLTQYGLEVGHGYEYADGSKLWFAYAMNSGNGDFPDALHPNSMVAFCGCSALRNDESDCDAAYACVFPRNRDWDVVAYLDESWATNNRAEYMAALAALERANVKDKDKSKVLFIYSHSRLLTMSMKKWVYRWRNNGWRTVEGTDIQNRDMLEKLMAAQGSRRVLWRRLKSKSGGRNWPAFWYAIAKGAAQQEAHSIDSN
ncbi:unnamed protein product [Phytophthora lilii]|uniref:ribonuclease H n=1 Tax=Phytophthora lilii TaxID=2077276 RepID=A0A9W6TH60_9STRA|nr:unnamed protein product [Phytophthora lilii]